MTFYNRNGILYVSIGGRRISTKLEYSKDNIKLYKSYSQNNEFFKKFDVKNKNKTIVDFCEEVLAEKDRKLSPTTMISYHSLYSSRIIPYFSKKYPQETTPLFLKEWYSTFTDKATLNTCISGILKPAFENAIIEEYITTSPFIVKTPTLKSSYEMNPFNIQEIQLILDTATGWFKNFIGVAFFTGARTGEVLALEWSDIDFIDSTININKTRSSGFTKKPKTKSSIRTIDMLSQTEIFLKEQRKITGLSKKVFFRQGTDFRDSNSLRNIWIQLLNKCNLKYRSIYQTRHTFASNMVSNGEDPFWVSKMLGHKNPNITLERYSKYIKSKRAKKTTFLDSENISFNTKIAH